MKYKVKTQKNIISVKDDFATLVRVDDQANLVYFDFRYSINQSTAIKNSFTKVKVSVQSSVLPKRPIVEKNYLGQVNNLNLVNNLLKNVQSNKETIDKNLQEVLAIRNSDITAFVNNAAVAQLKSGAAPEDLASLRKSKLKTITVDNIKNVNEKKQILQSRIDDDFTKILEENVSGNLHKKFSKELLFLKGVDPTSVADLPSGVLSDYESYAGINTNTERRNGWKIDSLLYEDLVKEKFSKKATDSSTIEQGYMNVVVSEVVDKINIPIRVALPLEESVLDFSRNNNNYFVKFELLGSKENSVEEIVIKTLDVGKYLKLYRTPTKPPKVRVIKSLGDKIKLSIKQIDRIADSIVVYKKDVSIVNTDVNPPEYTYVGTYPANRKYPVELTFEDSDRLTSIYRCIPAYKSYIGSCFTNVVAKARYRHTKTLSLTSKPYDGGILLEARDLPIDAVSLQFLQKNISIRQKKHSFLEEPIIIDDSIRNSDYVSLKAESLTNESIYEFSIMCYYRDGTSEIIAHEIVEYIEQTPGKITIDVENLKIEQDKSSDWEVKFQVNLIATNQDLDEIKTILERQGNLAYFGGDIEKERDALRSLLAYEIERVNLHTGERENLGIFTNPEFSDRSSSKAFGSSRLAVGVTYRYIIQAIIRKTETVFEKFIKKAKDARTNKTYNFNPWKFLHPKIAKTGAIFTPVGINSLFSDSALKHGLVGSSTVIDVKIEDEQTFAHSGKVESINKTKNLISWQITGNSGKIDHFIVMKKNYKIKTILGCAHAQTDSNYAQWIHDISPIDQGQIQYVIVPVMHDYSKATPLSTNSIIVEVD